MHEPTAALKARFIDTRNDLTIPRVLTGEIIEPGARPDFEIESYAATN
jgi:hypothetical protein